MTDAQTAQFTSFLRAQLQSLYGENFTESDIRDAISQDFHANKKPNQLRMILAVVVALVITIVTSGADGGWSLGQALALTGWQATLVSAAFTAIVTGISTQLITTGRVDFQALFQNIAISAITGGLANGLGDFVGSLDIVNGLGTIGSTIVQYGVRGAVAGGIAEATGNGNFRTAFTGSIVSSLAADGARWIGSNAGFPQDTNPVGNAIAHAILGCAAASAQRQDCASGAVGGATSSLLSPFIDRLYDGTSTNVHNALTAGTATLVSGLVTTALGGNGVTGANAGANEVQNNFLSRSADVNSERFRRGLANLTQCTTELSCRSNAAMLGAQADALSDLKIQEICGQDATCVQQRQSERLMYGQARSEITMRLGEGAARLAALDRLDGTSGFNRLELNDAIVRIQAGTPSNRPVDVLVRAELMKDPALLAAVLGLGMLDSDGGGSLSRFGSGFSARSARGAVADANFAQDSIRSDRAFSADGQRIYSEIAGGTIRTVDDLADAIRAGRISVNQIPVDYVDINGVRLILNTRTSTALQDAGIPRSDWFGRNQTGIQVPGMPQGTTFSDLARTQLRTNGLPPTGAPRLGP
jgi:filamentous hemagglutinin